MSALAAVLEPLRSALLRQRAAFLADVPVSLETRHDRVERGLAMILAHRHKLHAATMQDFPTRPSEWTLLAEIFAPVQVFEAALKGLPRWMRPQRRPAPMPFRLFGASAEIQYQPLGVVGIMAAWNAPLNLLLVPMAAALAAGNRVMLCPSDQMPAIAKALREAVNEYFDETEVVVVEGGLEVSKAFSALPFDHLLFTGSPPVGALVMAAAAPNLVPVTLELGGKCPVIVAPDADIDDAAHRIVGAKLLNGGQACLAPDHLFVPRNQLDALLDKMDAATRALLPGGVANPDYCGLLNARHYDRLSGIIVAASDQAGARVRVLGDAAADDPQRRRIALRVVIDPPADSAVMHEELFGPVLVLSTYDDPAEACARIRAAPKPLGLYVFSKSASVRQFLLDRTFSGGVTLNDVLFHYSVPDLPFGGVGRSGMGAYSFGIEGFRRFSHARSVYKQAGPRALLRVMQPPYGRLFDWVIRGHVEKLARRYEKKSFSRVIGTRLKD